MKKKVLQTLILVLTLIFLVILVTIISLIYSKQEEEEYIVPEMGDGYQDEHTDDRYNELENQVVSSADYGVIRNCLQQYIDLINFKNPIYYGFNSDNDYTFITTEQDISKDVYDILSTEFIETNNITETTVFRHINKLSESGLISILEMKKLNESNKIKTFAVHMFVQDMIDFSIIGDYYIVVNIDENNNTYALTPVNAKSVEEIKIQTDIKKIEANQNNKFKYISMTDENVTKEYINKYKILSIVYPEFVYNNILDKEYREKRFGSVQIFCEYVKNNIDEIKSINLENYQKSFKGSEYIQYVCIDRNGKYYIIRGNSIMDYTLILDTYTIDLPEFIEKYDKGTEEQKLQLNVGKIFEAIKHKDYEYVYNKLDNTFKNNNFKNITTFENYIKNNFYENSEIKEFNYRKEGSVYICTLGISNKDKSSETKSVTILMKLLENREFEISFSI